jgi:anti-sigma B factor antagonist
MVFARRQWVYTYDRRSSGGASTKRRGCANARKASIALPPLRAASKAKKISAMTNPLRLGLDVRQVEGTPVLFVTGEIDIYTAPLFKQAVVNLVSEGTKDVVIDLSGVTFMDSSGFGTLLGATRRLRPSGGGLHLSGPNSTIQRMLKLTRLDTIMRIYESAGEAVRAVDQQKVAQAAA